MNAGEPAPGVRSVVPDTDDIDLLVLNHADRDHINGADELLESYRVREDCQDRDFARHGDLGGH